MYPGPNRHPVDPRSVSSLVYILEIYIDLRDILRKKKTKCWLFGVLSVPLNCWVGDYRGASDLNRIERLRCIIIICLVTLTLLESRCLVY